MLAKTILPVACVLAMTALTQASAQTCGDLNDSGEVTVADALVLLRSAVGEPVTLQCPAPGVLGRTGQSMCWNAVGVEINCNGTFQDGDTRTGQPLAFSDNDNGTVTDNVTGLMWEKLSRNGTIHEVSDTFGWTNAFVKIHTLNDNKFGGFNDWRLPNERELYSLVTFGGVAEQTISAVFRDDCEAGCAVSTCSCTATGRYWSATTDPYVPAKAEGVDFSQAATFSAAKDTAQFVRAVRTVTDK